MVWCAWRPRRGPGYEQGTSHTYTHTTHPNRHRWHNYLKPNIRKDAWRPEEDKLILDYHHSFCNKWSKIAEYLPGRCVWLAACCVFVYELYLWIWMPCTCGIYGLSRIYPYKD